MQATFERTAQNLMAQRTFRHEQEGKIQIAGLEETICGRKGPLNQWLALVLVAIPSNLLFALSASLEP